MTRKHSFSTILLLSLLSLFSLALAGTDYYELLGVPRDAHVSVIKKSYRRLARLYHPDKHPGDAKMEAKFKDISKAYEVLADQQKRKTYDQFGEEGLQQGGGGGDGFHNFGGFGGGDGSFRMEFDASAFEDMFSGGFGGFGGGFGGGDFGGGSRRRKKEHRKKICSETKVCEHGRCFMIKECRT